MKPFVSSNATLPSPRPRVKAIRQVFSACEPPEICPTIATIRPRGGGISDRRCHAAGSRRNMGRLRAATGSGSGASRPASGLPQVGAVLLRLLPQIRSFPSRPHQPWPLSHQARIQKPVGGPEEPGRGCRAAPHPGSPGAGPNPSFAPSDTRCQTTCNARPGRASPVQSVATPSGEGGPAATTATTATADSRAAPSHTPGPASRPGSPIGWRLGNDNLCLMEPAGWELPRSLAVSSP